MGIVYEAADLDNGRRSRSRRRCGRCGTRPSAAGSCAKGASRLPSAIQIPSTCSAPRRSTASPVIALGVGDGGSLQRAGHRGMARSRRPRRWTPSSRSSRAWLQRRQQAFFTATSSRRTATSTPRLASKVGDFGLSISTLTPDETAASLERARYWAHRRSRRPSSSAVKTIDARSDLYAVGATLYYLLAGRAPFKDYTGPIDLPRPPGGARAVARRTPGRRAGAREVVLRCLAKDPADRPQSYDELARRCGPSDRRRPTRPRSACARWPASST